MSVYPALKIVAARGASALAQPSARTAIVVDASCDLPPAFFARPDVVVLPIAVKVGNMEYVDNHSPETIRRFLSENIDGGGASAETVPYSVDQFRTLFLERLVLDYDSIYCLTVSARRSEIHDNASRASIQILGDSRAVRAAAGITRPFMLRVIDTKSLFSGQGIVALELADLLAQGLPARDVTPRLFQVVESTYGYFVPDDLRYLRTRASKRGDRSVGLIGSILGSTLDIKPVICAHQGLTAPVAKLRGRENAMRKLFQFVSARIRAGLLSPHVNVCYGGDLSELHDMPGYAAMAALCDDSGIKLHESMMSVTGCVNVGPRGVAIAFAAAPHQATF